MGFFDFCTQRPSERKKKSQQGSQQFQSQQFQSQQFETKGLNESQQLQGSANSLGSTRSGGTGPSLLSFILVPWACAVLCVLITTLSAGSSLFWVIAPSILIIGASSSLAWEKFHRQQTSTAMFYSLCLVAGFSGFFASLIAYIHYLRPYHELGMGATYLDMLPSQSAMGATDATALFFAHGTSIDTARTYGYVDARNSGGNTYCVAPLSNNYTMREPSVQFFAAGMNCCGKRSAFGCGQGGSGARGAMILAREDNADPGFKAAVEGAAVEYGLQPGNGYLLLYMLTDPMVFRQDKLDNALKLLLIYTLVYLVIACMTGFMAKNYDNMATHVRHRGESPEMGKTSLPIHNKWSGDRLGGQNPTAHGRADSQQRPWMQNPTAHGCC